MKAFLTTFLLAMACIAFGQPDSRQQKIRTPFQVTISVASASWFMTGNENRCLRANCFRRGDTTPKPSIPKLRKPKRNAALLSSVTR